MEDDDDLWRLKVGRFSDAEARFYDRLFRWRPPRPDGLSPRALRWRTSHVEGGWRLNDGPQVVVKAAGSRKSRSGVRACVRYVARLRAQDCDEVPVFDEFGRPVARDRILKVLESWGLGDDSDNLSAKARRQPGMELPERIRLRNVQAWHFIFSIKAEDDTDVSEPLIRAVAATIDSLFTARGHRVVWALHRDCPGRPHIHAVVKAQSQFGARLRCDIHGDLFDTMRADFAANLSRVGLRFQAARREDRQESRDRILRGQERLRPQLRRGRGDGDLIHRAPGWLCTFAQDHLAGQGKEAVAAAKPSWLAAWLERIRPRPEPLSPSVPPELEGAYRQFQRVYRDPTRALASWQAMALEGACRNAGGAAVYPTRRLAEWYAEHRPELFGEVLPGALAHVDSHVLRRLPLPPPESVAPRQPLNPSILDAFVRMRWRRRVWRDRSLVMASLIRLAGMAHRRLISDSLTRNLLRRAEAALEVPMGPMPVPRPLAGPKPASDGGGSVPSASIRDPAKPPPALEIHPPPLAKGMPIRTRLRSGRGELEH